MLVHNAYAVFQGVAANGQRYVGITNNLTRRSGEHLRNGTVIKGIEGLEGLTRKQARGVEQALISHFGLDNLFNKINSIARKDPKYDNAVQSGKNLLKGIGFEGF